MMGKLKQLAIRDAKFINNRGGFQQQIFLASKDGLVTGSLTGFATKHWIQIDTDGNPINAKNAHVTLDETVLTSMGFTVRNSRGEVAMLNYKVSYTDSSGLLKDYVVIESYPDETLGLIVLILGDYVDN